MSPADRRHRLFVLAALAAAALGLAAGVAGAALHDAGNPNR
jgi:hypothetical protein